MSNEDIVIQIRLPRWRRSAFATLAALLVAGIGGTAFADVVWTPFAPGEKLTAAKMNTNLMNLAAAVNALQAQAGAGVSYCGTSAMQPNGKLGGYAGANKLCQPACQNAQTAHVCRADEVIRLAPGGQLGVGVFASGLFISPGPSDCQGFGTNGGGAFSWDPNLDGGPYGTGCNTPFALLCCK